MITLLAQMLLCISKSQTCKLIKKKVVIAQFWVMTTFNFLYIRTFSVLQFH